MDKWLDYVWVALGSALGGASRHWFSGFIAQRMGERFPAGTLCVNLTGSFLIGLLAAFTVPEGRLFLGRSPRLLLMVGVLGGYTTFSSFSLQTLNLARDGEWLAAALNIAASVVLCLAGVWLGHLLGQTLNR
jgi:fluoride exporter